MADLYTLPVTASAGSIYLSKNLDTTKDVVVSFEYACYGPEAVGSEGFNVFFFDTFAGFLSGGGPGPGLCYTPVFGITAFSNNQTVTNFDGVNYGQLGIGFDITGNYGTSGFGVDGFDVGIPNSISIRLSQENLYSLQYRTPSLIQPGADKPFSFYQQITGADQPEFHQIRIRLTDFGQTIIVDRKASCDEEFVNYVNTSIEQIWAPSVNCCLSFASGLTSTYFALKNFNVNGIFTPVTAAPITNTWTYSGVYYLGQDPNPAVLTVRDTITIQNAPPWNNYPPLILITAEGSAPFQNTDGYINITYT